MLELAAHRARFTDAGYRDTAHAEVLQIAFHRGLAVTPVGGPTRAVCPVRVLIRAIAGTSCGALAGFPTSTL